MWCVYPAKLSVTPLTTRVVDAVASHFLLVVALMQFCSGLGLAGIRHYVPVIVRGCQVRFCVFRNNDWQGSGRSSRRTFRLLLPLEAFAAGEAARRFESGPNN